MREQIKEIENRMNAIMVETIKMEKEETLGKPSTGARLVIYAKNSSPINI